MAAQPTSITQERPIYECVSSEDESWRNRYKNARVTPPIPDNAETTALAGDLLSRGLENHEPGMDLMDILVGGYQQKRMEEWAKEDAERDKRNAQTPTKHPAKMPLDHATRDSMSTHNFMQQCYRHPPN